MRLILQDGDSKRGLRLKDGTFSIGSAESCKITLASDGVAEHHADLVVNGDRVQIVAVSDEHAVLMGGEAIEGSTNLESGQLFTVGQARFKLDKDSAPNPAKPQAPVAKGRAGARSSAARAGAESPQRVERSSRRPQGKSFPTWLILLLAVPAVLIAYKMFGAAVTTDEAGGFSEKTSRIRIEESLAMSDADAAIKELAWVRKHSASLTPDWIEVFDGLEVKAKDMTKVTTATVNVVDGEQRVEKLKKYMGRYLLKNTRPEAREFLRRADTFLKEYSGHPEFDWVQRQRDHFAKYAKPEEPDTLDDLLVDVKFRTKGKPRNYIKARASIASFQTRTNEGDEALATRLAELTEEEKEYYEEQLDLAAGLWERDNKKASLSKIMMLLSGLSNPAYSDDCARRITEMPGVLNALKGYKRGQPFFLKQCAEANANFAAFLKKNGL